MVGKKRAPATRRSPKDLASRGYAVFAIDHPYMGRTALPNGQVTAASEDQFHTPAEIMDYYGRDLLFVLDPIAKLNVKDPILARRLDLSRIAAIGHSSVSAVSNACRRDRRLKACVHIDAPGFTAALLNGLSQPLLWIRMERAGPLPPEFVSTRTAAAYDLQIKDARHDSVEDWNYLEARTRSRGPPPDRAAHLPSRLLAEIPARSRFTAPAQLPDRGSDPYLLPR